MFKGLKSSILKKSSRRQVNSGPNFADKPANKEASNPLGNISLWDNVGRVCVYLLFGLVPVFFLPVTSFPVAENKGALGVVLVLVALSAWLVKVLNLGTISLPKTKLWLFSAMFLVVGGISTVLSDSFNLSLWGYLSSADSYFYLVSYVLALFIVPAFLTEIGHLIRAMFLFSVSLLVIAVFSLLQLFEIYLLPFEFSRVSSFNPVGNPQSLAIFLGSGLVMIMALLTIFKLSSGMKALFSVAGLLLGAILLLVNYNFVWLGLFLGSVILVSWQVMSSRKGAVASEGCATLAPKFGLPVVLMIIVAILFFVRPPISSIVQIPPEVRPSLPATLDIAKESLTDDVSNLAFGSGPSSFLYEYLKYRPQEINATAFWGVRFTQGFSALSTLLVTVGGAGVVALLLMFASFTILALKGITARNISASPAAEKVALVSFVSFLFLFLFWLIYPINFSIYLFTFLFMGLVVAALQVGGGVKTFNFSFAKSPQLTFA